MMGWTALSDGARPFSRSGEEPAPERRPGGGPKGRMRGRTVRRDDTTGVPSPLPLSLWERDSPLLCSREKAAALSPPS